MKNSILYTLAVILIACCAPQAKAQSGQFALTCESAALDSMLRVNVRTNYNQSTIDGYRIQVYSGSGVSSKNDAAKAQSAFLKLFPDEKVYMTYSAPFWRVRIGDYRFRSEAMTLLAKVKRHFPGSYVVRDNSVRKNAFVK